MATRWVINMEITDIIDKYDAHSLMEDIKVKWLPVSLNLTLDKLSVNGRYNGPGKVET